MTAQSRAVRRRHKRAAAGRKSREAELFGFQILLLILVFFVWAVGARAVVVFAVPQSACIEMLVTFGGHGGNLPVFKAFLITSFLLAGLWAVIGFAYLGCLWRHVAGVFHLLLGGAIFLLIMNFQMLVQDDFIAPDGTLAVHSLVRDMSSGEAHYAPNFHSLPEWGRWVAQSEVQDDRPVTQWEQQCVWIDKELITLGSGTRNIDGYVDASFNDKKMLYGELPLLYVDGKVDVGRRWADELSALFLSRGLSAVERQQASQIYRPMTADEVARFKRKQACRKDITQETARCAYVWEYSEAYLTGDSR